MQDFYEASVGEQAKRLERLGRRALDHWGISSDARVDLIKHRENAVFSVRDGPTRYALRVHRAAYHSDAELESELRWMAAISCEALRTPQVIPTKSGARFARISASGVPEERQVDLLEWFEGAPLGSVEQGIEASVSLEETFGRIGELMALTHDHGERWQRPPSFERPSWDENGLLGSDPLWGRYWELPSLSGEQRSRLEEVREKALQALADFGKGPDRYGLIHADFVPENLLCGDAGICLIDFDDSGFGWHLFDFATLLFFQQGSDDLDAATAALVAGYRTRRGLPDEHLERLPLFLLLRGLTYLGWAHTRSETETARQLTPLIVEGVDAMVREFI
jgi:Ser/Thr protein kinase RdoA (MazF antagonist)